MNIYGSCVLVGSGAAWWLGGWLRWAVVDYLKKGHSYTINQQSEQLQKPLGAGVDIRHGLPFLEKKEAKKRHKPSILHSFKQNLNGIS